MAVEGNVEPRFERVREVFAENFEERDEVGAALCIYHEGRSVVDLWGGIADVDEERPWERDTLGTMDSATKGLTAICALALVEAGELDLDAPVARYWPEFAAAGKQELPVRLLLTHQAGLPAVDRWITMDDFEAWTPVVDALAAQRPYWEPGTAHGYHGITMGHLVGEVVRRISGLTPGAFLRERISPALGGLETWIGLPEAEEPRVAAVTRVELSVEAFSRPSGDARYDAFLQESIALWTDPAYLEAYMDPSKRSDAWFEQERPLSQRSLGPVEIGEDMNSRRHHAVEVPAATGITTSRSLARLWAALIGEVDGARLIGPRLLDEAVRPYAKGPDRVVLADTAWGLGFAVPGGLFFPDFGTGRTFGSPGANGTLAFADPDQSLALGYVRNFQEWQFPDSRSTPLLEAVYACLRE
ncbi:EstA family serine hydrolase [Conexibacter woesei]|uniref:Beta-lactamase n=1 Tax=Conexibacter woesei (strain DSM 14684 / CCUG 47730 / CIP 108061 / JCM 11494 / NBRC 100937 / ID131577) TaxID=469383 RepID=D3F4A4_CONWI|nr:EstA family serine hydrolase [Conexibacter woesei]ADB50476.1 beta-lactamase [Conexibacter woesei DSM 14684]